MFASQDMQPPLTSRQGLDYRGRVQPVVQAQIPVVQGLLCGNSSEKGRTTEKKALAYRGKHGQNTDAAFVALRLGVVLYPLIGCGVGSRKCVNPGEVPTIISR